MIDRLADTVRVVDQHRRLRAARAGDALDAAWHLRAGGDAGRDHLRRHAERRADAAGDQHVLDVEIAEQRDRQLERASGERHARARTVHAHVGHLQTHLCVGDAGDADHARAAAAGRLREPGAGGIVDVDDRAAALGQVVREQQRLRVAVGRHRAVEVEVLGREIGEDRDVDLVAADLPERERVRRRLEHAPRAAGDEQLGKELLYLHRLLRALARFVLPLVARELEVHRRGEAGALATRLEHVGYQVHGGGLPIGPGDADDPQLARRMIEDLRREISERGSSVGHQRCRNVRE